MRFGSLSLELRIYILAHLPAVAPVLWAVGSSAPPDSPALVGLLLLFTCLFSTWKVELPILQGRITPTVAVVCLALLLQGAGAALLCTMVGTLVGSYLRPTKGGWRIQLLRPPVHQVFFNVANGILTCGLASLVYRGVAGQPWPDGWGLVLGLLLFTICYFLINTGGVAMALALRQGRSWPAVWCSSFRWTAPGYFASVSAAAGIYRMYQQMGAWSLLFLPPLYLIYYSFRIYSEKSTQDQAHIHELRTLNQAIISSLAMAIEAKDRYTCSHVHRVQHYALSLARAVGLVGPEFQAVSTGALVHDIGKLGIPDHILGKPGKLTPEEFQRIQTHVAIGAEILSPIPFDAPVVEVVLTHHERWDGQGYPRGLRGEEIPMGGRIIAIVDVFDALTSDRPYRRAMPDAEAIRVLEEGAGKHFDPALVARFLEILPQAQAELAALEDEHRAAGSQAAAAEAPSALVQINQAVVEMAAVCDVAHSLSEHETVDRMAGALVGRALALLPVETAVLYLPLPESDELVAAEVAGCYRERLMEMTLRVGEGSVGWVALHGRPQANVSAALDLSRRFLPGETLGLELGTAAPLLHDGALQGVLAVYGSAAEPLSEQHQHILAMLADHAATAIHRLRRFARNEELAVTDPMTGLVNQRGVMSNLEKLIERAKQPSRPQEARFSLLLLDLDGFKAVNDTLGHLRGDEVLRQVGATLRRLARDQDVVARYAGDEFVLLLPGAEREQAEQVARRLRKGIEALPAVDGEVKIGASIGVATYATDGHDARELIQAADQWMYADKARRRVERAAAGSGFRGAAAVPARCG